MPTLKNQNIQPICINGIKIIDFYVTTPRSNDLVRRMIPVLVDLAKRHQNPITYGQLATLIGHNTSRIGYQLGCIIDVIERLSQELGTHIPCLTGLCVLANNNLPSGSIDRVIPDYENLIDDEKRNEVARINQEAYDYEDWDDVLIYLGL